MPIFYTYKMTIAHNINKLLSITSKKERRKATNRKASANYRAKQVKNRNAKGAKKLEQEEIQKKLELDNHAIKMQIEYMMKTFSQRIKQTL